MKYNERIRNIREDHNLTQQKFPSITSGRAIFHPLTPQNKPGATIQQLKYPPHQTRLFVVKSFRMTQKRNIEHIKVGKRKRNRL